MLIRLLTALTFLIYASTAAFAQSSPATQNAPEISLRGDDDLGTFDQTGLILEKLNISVDIHAGLAQISLGATLRNETEDQVEASFAYPLPKGTVINGYALDLDGELVDGVLMPKERAEALYTDRVTQSIDPGIAARTVDNRYKTRIYPIEEEGGRRSIRLDFTAPVPAGGLRLPFASDAPVEQVSLNITGDGAELAKTPITGSTATDTVLSGDIFIPAVAAEAALSEHKGQTLLTVPLTEKTSEKMAATTQGVQSIAVIWDTSLSRMENDLAAERRFVSAVLADLSLQKQSLIYGADRAEFAARYETPAQLDAAIGRLTYDGATNLSALLDVETLSRPDIDADICLIISDGKSSLGQGGLPSLPCRVFTFSAAKNPNTDWLSLLASRNNGADLSGVGTRDAARRIRQGGGLQLAPGQFGEILSFGNRHWFIAPVDEDARSFTLNLKNSSQGVSLRKLTTQPHLAAGAIWGQRRMAELRSGGASNFDAVVKASRRWNVQGKETSFLVLEDANDYIEAKIDPPISFPAERMEYYKEELAWAREDEAEDRADHLEDILDSWENQIEWWETDWAEEAEFNLAPEPVPVAAPPPPVARPTTGSEGPIVQNPTSSLPEPAPQPLVVQEAPLEDWDGSNVNDVASNSELDEIIVTGARRVSRAGTLPPEITVTIRDWSPDRPFLKALSDLDAAAFEREYIKQRSEHGDRPSFYLEVADQLHSKGKIDRAARMAATALELPSVTTITRSNVADRLLMYGDSQTAIDLYREILPAAQDRPQAYYNLAVALIKAGDAVKGEAQETLYREALGLLVHVINEPWEDDYEGIHLIALQDLNRTLAHLPKRKRKKIQKELNLDVDIRVLVDWTADDADLDIHVIERVNAEDEEEAYYSNRATEMGGRVSNDMTEGYGPEEYLIRNAPDGLYRVESDYYAQDEYTEDGALKLRARIWRNFGRKNETSDTVIIEMLEEKEDAYILGEIQIGPVVAADGGSE